MGLIARQSIKGSIYSYLGAIFGLVNSAILMPKLFSTAQIGLVNLLVAISMIFGQVGSLGMANVTTRMFPYFRDHKNKHNGFLFFALIVGIVGFVLCAVVYLIIKPTLIQINSEKSPLFAEYIYLLIPFIFFTIFLTIIDSYNRILFNASFGIFVKEFLWRILNFVGIVLFYFDVFDFRAFIIYYTVVYGAPVVLTCFLLIWNRQFSLQPSAKMFRNRKFSCEMVSVALFGIISGFSSITAGQIDRYFINHYCDLSLTGVYSTVFFFGSVIMLAGRSLMRISGAVVAEAFKSNDLATVARVYRKSTVTLTAVGVLIFVIIWSNVNNILNFLPPEYESGRYVIFFVGLAHLFQISAGVSDQIIQYSRYYRQFTVFMLLLMTSIVLLDLWLLPIFGITGGGIACAVSFFLFVLIRTIFLKRKMQMQPYGRPHFFIAVWGGVAYLANVFIPEICNLYVDTVIRTAIIVVVFGIPMIKFHYSEDFNNLFDNIVNVVFKRKANKIGACEKKSKSEC